MPHPVARARPRGKELTIAEAAARLGVTTRQAQRLAAAGPLHVLRQVGRALLVEDPSATALARDAGAGRHWNPRTAWVAIEVLKHGSTDSVMGSTASWLRRRLHERWVRMLERRKRPTIATVALAREVASVALVVGRHGRGPCRIGPTARAGPPVLPGGSAWSDPRNTYEQHRGPRVRCDARSWTSGALQPNTVLRYPTRAYL